PGCPAPPRRCRRDRASLPRPRAGGPAHRPAGRRGGRPRHRVRPFRPAPPGGPLMSMTATPAARTAALPARPPGALRLGLSRGWLEIREFSREWEQLLFTFSLPALLLVLLSAVFAGDGDAGPAVAAYYTA